MGGGGSALPVKCGFVEQTNSFKLAFGGKNTKHLKQTGST
jgi:hypothetical protein